MMLRGQFMKESMQVLSPCITTGPEAHGRASRKAFIEEQSGRFNGVTQEATKKPVLSLRLSDLMRELRTICRNKPAKFALSSDLLLSHDIAAHLEHLRDVQLTLKATKESAQRRLQVNLQMEYIG